MCNGKSTPKSGVDLQDRRPIRSSYRLKAYRAEETRNRFNNFFRDVGKNGILDGYCLRNFPASYLTPIVRNCATAAASVIYKDVDGKLWPANELLDNQV